MREILFRGKRIDNGEWVYGYYVYTKDSKGKYQHFIVTPEWFIVDPSTVGQCVSNLSDMYGKKIFEKDIVKITCVLDDSERVTAVIYDSGLFGVKHEDHAIPSIIPLRAYDTYSQIEVIGNIHDNPELVKGEQHD